MYNLQIEYFTPFPRELLGSKLKGHWTSSTLIRHSIIKYILQPIKAISNVKIQQGNNYFSMNVALWDGYALFHLTY